MQRKLDKKFFVFEIIASKLFALNCLYKADTASHRLLCKGSLKHGFLDIYLNIFFGASISGNTSAMRVIFFWQMFKA